MSTTVARDGGTWRVVHTLRDGRPIERNVQYNMQDVSIDDGVAWEGALNRNASMNMHGELIKQSDGRYRYTESLRDHTGDVVMFSETYCTVDPVVAQAPAPAPQYVPPSPAPSYGGTGDAVPFTMVRNSIIVRVNLPGYWANMILDTGAGMGQIQASLANDLVTAGHATEQGTGKFCMANGACDMERVVVVDSLTIGSHTVNNVRMSVVPDGTEMLLGLPILNAIGRFTIDSANHQLTFG